MLLAGVYKSHNESTESLWDETKGRPIFRATMSLERFKIISRIFRFDARQTRSSRRASDKFAPIRELWEKWVEILPKHFNPTEYVTVDERLVGFRGKCPFRQYMPKKPAKYGIKFWVVCDNATSYVWNIQPYLGKPQGALPEKNQGLRVVLDLTVGLKGHNVTCDNFFTSYGLGQTLLRRGITMVGTIKKNKPTLPPQLLETKNVPALTSKFAFTKDTTLVSYFPKKNKCVVLQSTLHHDDKISCNDDKKPLLILDYNKPKGAVDTLDKMCANYTSKRKTNRWPIVVFSNILDISGVNSFVLFTSINLQWKPKCNDRRRIFLENLGESLIKKHIDRRQYMPRGKAARDVVERVQAERAVPTQSIMKNPDTMQRKRGRCQLCPKTDNKSSVKCSKCDKFTCKNHLTHICNKCFSEIV